MHRKDKIRIFLADDHQIFIEGVKSILRDLKDLDCEVVGEANNGEMVLKTFQKANPHLLLLDVNLPDMDGLEVVEKIKKYDTKLKIILLTMYDESKIVRAAFKIGVDGYILKRTGIKELSKSIKEVMSGNTFTGQGVYFSKDSSRKDTLSNAGLAYADKFVKRYHLTKRELQVLKLIAQAMNKKQIAQELYISEQTVSVHKKNIMRKLGVTNNAELIKLVYDKNIV